MKKKLLQPLFKPRSIYSCPLPSPSHDTVLLKALSLKKLEASGGQRRFNKVLTFLSRKFSCSSSRRVFFHSQSVLCLEKQAAKTRHKTSLNLSLISWEFCSERKNIVHVSLRKNIILCIQYVLREKISSKTIKNRMFQWSYFIIVFIYFNYLVTR